MAERITTADMMMSFTTTLFLCLYMSSTVLCSGVAIDEFAKSVALKVSRNLTEKTKEITSYHKIKANFQSVRYDIDYRTTVKKLDGREVIQKFKRDLEGIFREKTQALKNIKRQAEEVKERHQDDENIEPFEYFNMKNINTTVSLKIHYPFSTSVKVNISHSFVQIPTNIYEKTPKILNTVKWTEKLDDTFKSNYDQSNETLLYQYYGDKSGLMRIYPGNKIGEQGKEGNIDLFDCRRRVWYIQASASPKDIVIIIDMSGSMKGSNKGIARIAAASLIETLSENDYFNVITVNEKVSYVKPCATHLIQATKINKEAMRWAIQNLGKPVEKVDAELAIREAFKILYSGAKDNRTTASCNQAIMIISDGVEGDNVAEAVFEKYNKNRTVRVFSFFIGRTHVNVGEKGLKKMACDNRGYFYPIETVGNVWDTVLEYLQVMSRPMNESRNEQAVTYTPMYMDSAGLGMIMSISLGVFDKTGLVGVTGTDITLSSLLDKVPMSTFGPFSHVFIINNNGFVIMHPKLKNQTGYLVAPRNVFLEDLLLGACNNKSMDLKKKMINRGVNGAMSFPMYWLYDGDRKVAHVNANVFYEPIDGTDFSAGFVLVDNEITHQEFSEKALDKEIIGGIKALEIPSKEAGKYYHVQIARWEYCDKPYDSTTSKSMKNYYTAAELRKHLSKSGREKDLPANCNKVMLKRLLVTAAIVSKGVRKSWEKLIDNELYDGVFVSTNAGYTRYFSRNKEYARYKGEYTKPRHLDMAAANANATISVSAPYLGSDRYPTGPVYFTVTAAIKVGDEDILTAVSGVRIRSDYFQVVLDDAATKGKEKYCASNDTHICALIDKNGYIIASNQGERYIGRFVGEISGILMDELASERVGIFKKIKLEDTQAECEQTKDDSSDSRGLFTPFKLIYQGMSSLIQSVGWVALQYVTFLSSTISAEESSKTPKTKPLKVSCTMEMPFYVFQDERFRELQNIEKHKEATCDESCNMLYYLNPVQETNLLFLIAKSTKHCKNKCFHKKDKLRHTRKAYASICKMGQRYRRPPNACFNDAVQNEFEMCGHASYVIPSMWTPVVLCIVHLIMSILG